MMKIKTNFLVIAIITLILFAKLLTSKELYPIAIDDKVGYIDPSGNIVIPAQYETIVQYIEVDYKGKKIKSIKFPINAYFSEGLATAREGEYFWFIPLRYHYLMIDVEGKVVFPASEIEVGSFSESFAAFRKPKKHFQYVYDNYFGYFNKKFEEVIGSNYKWAGHFKEGLALVFDGKKYGFINRNDSVKIPIQFQDAYHFSEGLALASTKNLYGFIDKTGTFVIPEQYTKVWSFSEGLARVYHNKQYFFIDKTGNKTFDKEFEFAGDFSEGLAKVIVNGLYGFIDKSGIIAIPAQFTSASDFQDGLAAVEVNGKWGFIDKDGMFVISPKYDYAKNFIGLLAEVWIDDAMWYINKKGEKVSKVFWSEKTFLWW